MWRGWEGENIRLYTNPSCIQQTDTCARLHGLARWPGYCDRWIAVFGAFLDTFGLRGFFPKYKSISSGGSNVEACQRVVIYCPHASDVTTCETGMTG